MGVLGNAAAGLAGNAAAAAGFDGTTAGLVSGAADARVTAAAGLGGSALLAFYLAIGSACALLRWMRRGLRVRRRATG